MEPIRIGSVLWPYPLGIGAGLVKNGAMLLGYAQYGRAIEIGSITRHLRTGNPGRIVWKYPGENSLKHNAGMPNEGIENLVTDLVKIEKDITVPWGVNIAVTPGISDAAEAVLDVGETAQILLTSGLSPDWITLNIASPDTSDPVELLSEPARVKQLIHTIQGMAAQHEGPPLWLKIGPAMTNQRLMELVTIAMETGVAAVICGNALPADSAGGGWCGAVTRATANAALTWLCQQVGTRLPIIGSGGVISADDVQHKLDVGAVAVQMVSGLLLGGRSVVTDSNH